MTRPTLDYHWVPDTRYGYESPRPSRAREPKSASRSSELPPRPMRMLFCRCHSTAHAWYCLTSKQYISFFERIQISLAFGLVVAEGQQLGLRSGRRVLYKLLLNSLYFRLAIRQNNTNIPFFAIICLQMPRASILARGLAHMELENTAP